ncbi:hypothetical protein PHO31112_04777 [Pandoraea horticolens]|uniref:Uncharacterized protein n=1 Tax=Pandoraea horticolens TaxID=2508298 RepID=A0A5E4YV27_9BURK|nr:hypothetical protein [Pandoraea horticolens]VVE52342.1 hypothetical protein PHO31112_04777 [Pandoraea horticolens]
MQFPSWRLMHTKCIMSLWIVVVLASAWSQAAHALTGADVAALLNRRYELAVNTCGVGKPAWYCSGVLMRDIATDDKQFWKLDATDQALQSLAFTYRRQDVASTAPSSRIGMVLADLLTAVGEGKSYAMRCAYPVAAPLRDTDIDHGCNLTGMALPANPDVGDDSSCAVLGVNNAAQWASRYLGSAPGLQCSFSVQTPTPFNQTLQAHALANAAGLTPDVQLLAAAWDATHPSEIAIDALYYLADDKPQLREAQARQLAYYEATGTWLPLLRYAPDSSTPFGFDETDQLDYGNQVAARINARYFNTTPCPGDMAAYMCNGVVARVTGYGTNFHSWNPSPAAIAHNGVSAFYLRSDLRTDVVWLGGVGFVMREFEAPAQHPFVMRCMYPTDAYTGERVDKCGIWGNYSKSAPCAQLGITDLQGWTANYAITGYERQCSLGVDKAAFELSMQARSTLPNPIRNEVEKWNEAILAIWPQDIPSQLPLEAIFYIGSQLAGAQFIQNDYMQQTHRFLPILKIDETASTPFSYTPSDQIANGK